MRASAADMATASSPARFSGPCKGCRRASTSGAATSSSRLRLKLRAASVALFSISARTRRAMSTPSSTGSTGRLSTRISTVTPGWRFMKMGRIGPTLLCASVTGQLSRTVPRGSFCTWATASAPASAVSRTAMQWRR